jgi:hypothetical protein
MIDLAGKAQDWWPNLKGRTAVILASGPSQTREACELALGSGAYVVAINETWRLALRADALYACDWQWWKSKAPQAGDFRGLRVIATVLNRNGRPYLPGDMKWQLDHLHYFPTRAGAMVPLFAGRETGAGSSSAFQAANALARWGCDRIILTGVDCKDPPQHWHGNHAFPEYTRQKQTLADTWIEAWRQAAPIYAQRGVRIITCSPGTRLGVFPQMDLQEALQGL